MRDNGYLHYRYWLFFTAVVAIAIASWRFGSNDNISNLLSFAMTLASLIVSGLAILQTTVASVSTNQTLMSITAASGAVKQSADEVLGATRTLNEHVSQIPQSLGVMSDKLDRFFQTDSVSDETDAPDLPSVTQAPNSLSQLGIAPTIGGALSWYVAARAVQEQSKITLKELKIPKGWEGFVAGYLDAMRFLGQIDMKVTKGNVIHMKKLPYPPEDIISAILSQKGDTAVFKKYAALIDAYFDEVNAEEEDNDE